MIKFKKVNIVYITGILLVLAFILHILGFNLVTNMLLILSTFIAGYSIFIKALKSVRMKAFSIELLVSIAVIGALFIGEYVESAVVTFLFIFGSFLELKSLEKTRESLKKLIDMAPVEARVLRDKKEIVIPIEDVKEGDTILIQSGEKIPVDGKVISGKAFVNESSITGESVLLNKKINYEVFSGTIIDNGYIEVLASRVGDDTTFAKIIELVEEAQESKAKTQKFIDRFAHYYTPSIIILSILVFIVTKDIEMTLTFLVIACPGALVIAAPVSLVTGIGNGARNGTLLKGGEILERFSKVDTVVFDKTGTLTKGNPGVIKIRPLNIKEEEFLKLVAEVEVISEHHLGRTVVNEALNRKLELLNKPSIFNVIKGHGLTATIYDKEVVIGNKKLMDINNIVIPEFLTEEIINEEKKGYTVINIGIEGKYSGFISISDPIRKEAKESISLLKKHGIKNIIMLTGDNKHAAEKVSNLLGIDQVYSELLPEDKVDKIKELKNKGNNIAMVGDGINDAPALAMADIGIAMGNGTDVAMETSDVVLMSNNLNKITYALSLSKNTLKIMKQNMYFAVGTVILLLVGVLFGKVFLSSGMLIHELSVLLVIINAMRLMKKINI